MKINPTTIDEYARNMRDFSHMLQGRSIEDIQNNILYADDEIVVTEKEVDEFLMGIENPLPTSVG